MDFCNGIQHQNQLINLKLVMQEIENLKNLKDVKNEDNKDEMKMDKKEGKK